MTPKALMILGALVGIAAGVMDIAGLQSGFVLFAAGALFGKGYGVWETRSSLTETEGE